MAQRLEIMQPTLEGVEKCLQKEKPRFSWHAEGHEAPTGQRCVDISGIRRLRRNDRAGRRVVWDSERNICANTIPVDEKGDYKDFDRAAFTSRSGGGGKPAVVKHLKKTRGYKTVIMCGDGATEMDARPPADSFIGYGGVQVRQSVRDGPFWFVTHWRDVLSISK